mmetsp:Transcript_11707/g.25218  ORF Transcript_11707/g.25218 Transcript_11707/m.25218 type:complete len:822 (+) Transcript_11707:54-2519(+)
MVAGAEGVRSVAVLLVLLVPATGNWLLQCSQCVDQAYYSDDTQKKNLRALHLPDVYKQIKGVKLHQYDHANDEFVNKFFSQTHIGALAGDLKQVMPLAVGLVPERRWIAANGTSQSTRNVNLVRDSYLLYAGLGALQELMKMYETHAGAQTTRETEIDQIITELKTTMHSVLDEQEYNRQKREDLFDQILRAAATVEVLQKSIDLGDRRMEELGVVSNRLTTDVQDLFEVSERYNDTFKLVWQEIQREAEEGLVEFRKATEAQVEIELVKMQAKKIQLEEERATTRIKGEEQRKSEDHRDRVDKRRIEFEQQKKLETEKELLRLQEESNLRQSADKQEHEVKMLEMKLEAEKEQAEMKNKAALEQTKIEAESKIKERRENEDVHLRELKQKGEQENAARLAAIRETAEIIRNYVAEVFGNPEKLALAVGTIIAVCAGIYLAREMAILLREQLNKRLGRPSLVRSTNRISTWGEICMFVRSCCGRAPDPLQHFSDVVLSDALHKQICRLALASRTAKQRKAPLMNLMFYGPPGTGKTMCAMRYAQASGLEYAIMSGGDVAPLEDQAVTELHKLFSWVRRSRRGVLLFIDEADSFLGTRNSSMSEHLRNSLTTMLYHTGTPSSQFMLVLATNRPGDLDSAVLDRVDEAIEFGLPDMMEREKMISMYFRKMLSDPLGIPVLDPTKTPQKPAHAAGESDTAAGRDIVGQSVTTDHLKTVSQKVTGFSGREIAKMFVAVQTHVYASDQLQARATKQKTRGKRNLTMTADMLMEVVDKKVKEHGRTVDMITSGYTYEHQGTPLGSKSGKDIAALHASGFIPPKLKTP